MRCRRGADSGRGRRWGEAAAILAGDLLHPRRSRSIARLDVPVDESTRERLLDVLDHGVFVTAAGELADVSFSDRLGPDSPRSTTSWR